MVKYNFNFNNLLEKKNKTLILDLDETLIHSCNKWENPDAICKFKLTEDEEVFIHDVEDILC